MTVDPDLPLIEALQAGDGSALDTLMERHEAAIFGFAWRQLRDEAAARDVAQETFVRVYLHRAKYSPRGASVRSWIYRIASNLCTDHLRRASRSPTALTAAPPADAALSDALEQIASEEADPAEAAARAGELSALRQAIAELPAALRDPVTLFCLEERSQQECAEILGVTPKAIETKVGRARARLRERLARLLRR